MLEKVESICIYPNGHSDVVQLMIDGREKNISFDGSRNRIDLLESNEAVNASKFSLSFNGKQILIEQREVKEIKNQKIFECIDAMRNSLDKGEPIDWNNFELNSLDDVEQRFYEGFYDYYYSCTIKNEAKERLLLRAFNHLYPFSIYSPMASQVLIAICLYFNWIDEMSRICSALALNYLPHRFKIACMFLQSSTLIKEIPLQSGERKGIDIFIDSDDNAYLYAIQAFIDDDLNIVQNYLEQNLPRIDNGDAGQRLADKIFLLKARYNQRIGADNNQTKFYYSQIHDKHYQFEREIFNAKEK